MEEGIHKMTVGSVSQGLRCSPATMSSNAQAGIRLDMALGVDPIWI